MRKNTHLKYENACLKEQVSEWKKSSLFWENQYKNSEQNNDFNWLDVDSDYCTPEKLELSAFGNYLDDIVKKFLILQIYIYIFLHQPPTLTSTKQMQQRKSGFDGLIGTDFLFVTCF